MPVDHEGSYDLMIEFEDSSMSPMELAAALSEAEIRNLAAVTDEEIAGLNDTIEQAKSQRSARLSRLALLQQAIPLAAEKGLE